MEIGAVLFSLAMVLLVAAYVLRPLSEAERGAYRDPSRELYALQADRDRVLDSIHDLDMDHTMGKVPDEDYQRQRQSLALEGAEILRSIDQLSSNGTPDDSAMALEAAIAALREKRSNPDRQAVAGEADPSGRTCLDCGEAIFQDDRFCSNCGAALEEQVA